MLRFSERIRKIWDQYPDKVSFVDLNGTKMTNKEMDILSGRVARYLLDRNIGQEDVVMVILPRGVEVVAAVFGIMKVGACHIALDDFMPEKRVEYIKKDSKCKIVIDKKILEEIYTYEPIYDFRETDVHDLCFIVYTSGSTGNPKGAMLEYGVLDTNIISMATKKHALVDTKSFLNLSPFSYLTFQCSLSFIANNAAYCIMSCDLLKDYDLLDKTIDQYDIETVFLPSVLATSYRPKNSQLKYIIFSGSIVKGGYYEDVYTCNLYASSEVGYIASGFDIDKEYDVVPIGKSIIDSIFIEGDKDEGEIMIKVPFSRGYLGLKEENERKLIDGVFHTGDYAKKLASGDYVILSRMDDMVNINGNRVELMEITNVFSKVTGIKNVVTKYFEDNNSSYIVVYYISDKEIDKKIIEDKMQDYLPDAIMPRIFIRMDKFPLNQNGKIDKKNLPMSIFHKIQNEDDPINEIEKDLCTIFARVFGVDYISPLDDFVDMGCDSLVAIKILLECSEYNLSYGDIMEHKTPRAIARHIIATKKDGKKLDVDYKLHELMPVQEYFVREQYISKDTDKNNLCFIVKIKDDIDIKRLHDAINRSIDIHPTLEMMIVKENNNFYQAYKHSIYKNINVIKCTKSEYDEYIRKQRKSFDLFNEYGYRICIYDVEGEKYFSACFHHAVMDLVSIDIWVKDIERIYNGVDIKMDHYFDLINEFDAIKKSDRFKALNGRLIEKEKSIDTRHKSMLPNKDIEYVYDENLGYKTYIGGKAIYKTFDIKIPKKNVTSFYSTCLAKTIADYNGVDEVTITVVDSARNEKGFSDTCGCIVKDMLITHDFKDKTFIETMKEVGDKIKEQRKIDYNTVFDTVIASISILTKEMSFDFFGEKLDINDNKQVTDECDTDTDALVVFSDEGATMSVEFDENFHDEKNIETFVDMLKENIESNINNIG